MAFPLIQVDAFTDRPYGGNPAAVCPLTAAPSEGWMQQVAQEMNLSETAFVYPAEESGQFRLRWFTPTVEVDLCGHATLATAHVLWSEGYLPPTATAHFQTRSGPLSARRHGDWIELNFPSNPPAPVTPPPALLQALGLDPVAVAQSTLGYVVEVASAEVLRQLQPDLAALLTLPVAGLMVTCAGDPPYDVMSRFFAPALGIDEDPVTGAAHCCLAPYWHAKLGRAEFLAYQASARGGVVQVRHAGDRVALRGQAVTVLRGELLA